MIILEQNTRNYDCGLTIDRLALSPTAATTNHSHPFDLSSSSTADMSFYFSLLFHTIDHTNVHQAAAAARIPSIRTVHHSD